MNLTYFKSFLPKSSGPKKIFKCYNNLISHSQINRQIHKEQKKEEKRKEGTRREGGGGRKGDLV